MTANTFIIPSVCLQKYEVLSSQPRCVIPPWQSSLEWLSPFLSLIVLVLQTSVVSCYCLGTTSCLTPFLRKIFFSCQMSDKVLPRLWEVVEEEAAQGMRTDCGREMRNAMGKTAEVDSCSSIVSRIPYWLCRWSGWVIADVLQIRSQNNRGWKRPLGTVESNPLLKQFSYSRSHR